MRESVRKSEERGREKEVETDEITEIYVSENIWSDEEQ